MLVHTDLVTWKRESTWFGQIVFIEHVTVYGAFSVARAPSDPPAPTGYGIIGIEGEIAPGFQVDHLLWKAGHCFRRGLPPGGVSRQCLGLSDVRSPGRPTLG